MKERFESPFDSDAEAQEVIDTSDRIAMGMRTRWRKEPEWLNGVPVDPDNLPFTMMLDGTYSFAELMALIHFHPELIKQREQPSPVSDEVRVLELAVQKLSETLNEVLEVCDPAKASVGSVERQYVQLKRIFMRARASLPAGYSMSLTKEKKP